MLLRVCRLRCRFVLHGPRVGGVHLSGADGDDLVACSLAPDKEEASTGSTQVLLNL